MDILSLNYNEKLLKAFNLNPVMIIISTLEEGIIIDVNETFITYSGFARDELIGRTLFELNVLKNNEDGKKLLEVCTEECSLKNREIAVYSRSGKSIAGLLSSEIIEINNQKFILSMVMDITERKYMETRLKYHLSVEKIVGNIANSFINVPYGEIDDKINIALKDIGQFLDIDRCYLVVFTGGTLNCEEVYEWCREGVKSRIEQIKNISLEAFSWLLEEIKGKGLLKVNSLKEFPPEAWKEKDILEKTGIKSILNIPIVVNNQFIGWLGFNAEFREKIWDDNYLRLLRLVADVFINVLGRKKIERELNKSEEQFRKIMELSPDIISVIGNDGNLIYTSPVSEKFHGYSNNEIIGKNIFSFIHPEDIPYCNEMFNRQISEPDEIKRAEFRRICKDGNYKWMETVGTNQINNPLINGIITITRDITEHKKIEEELKEANATKDKLFSVISHDLRGPVGNIKSFIENIILSEPFNNEEIIVNLKRLRNISNSAFSLIDNLLFWSRSQRRKIQPNPRIINLKTLILNIVLLFKIDAENKNIGMNVKLNDEISVYADKEMLMAILRNLIINAIKFTGKFGNINISASEKDNLIEVSVSDSGIGICEANLRKILDKHINFSTRGTNNEKGTGLGIEVCKEFIEKNGGTLLIKSEPGKGSNFIFTIPRGQKKECTLEILLIDDGFPEKELFSSTIKNEGHYLDIVSNVGEATEFLCNKSFNMVFMDIKTRGIGGMNAMKILRTFNGNNSSIPIIAVTADETADNDINFMKYGIIEYIKRPLTANAILECIEKYK